MCICTWLSVCNLFKWQNWFPFWITQIENIWLSDYLLLPSQTSDWIITILYFRLRSLPDFVPVSSILFSLFVYVINDMYGEVGNEIYFPFVVDRRGSAWQYNAPKTTCGYMCLILYALFWQRSRGWLLLPLSDPLLLIMSVRVCGCVTEEQCA